jgi:hypothetical protein
MVDSSYPRCFETIHAAAIGEVAGVQLGAPVEPTIWSYDRISTYDGDIGDNQVLSLFAGAASSAPGVIGHHHLSDGAPWFASITQVGFPVEFS